jgi:hypothetical protein
VRGLNSIYNQALVPKTTSEKSSFAGYILAWCETTHKHHESVIHNLNSIINSKEEKFWFPEWEKRVPGSAAANFEQHRAFHDGMEKLERYANEVKTDPTKYDGHKVIEMIEEFGPVLHAHLNDEIDTLNPAILSQIFKTQDEAKEIIDKTMKWVAQTSSITMAIVFVLSNLESYVINCVM